MNRDLETGLAALEGGREAEAKLALGRVPTDDVAYARAQNLVAQIDLRAGALGAALAAARNAAQAAPAEFGCHMTLSRVSEALEDYRAARAASRAAIELDDRQYDAWFHNGTQALKMGDYADAAQAYRRAHALEPGRLEALVNLGSALDRMGDPAGALDAWNRALRLEADNPRVLLNIGRSQADAGDLEAAISTYRQALSNDPEFSEGWINLAVAHLKRGEPARAIEAVQRCLAVFPADRGATSLALMAYQQLGDMENYRRLYAFDELIYAAEVDTPDGFADIAAFNAALVAAVLSHPTLIHEPAGKSTRRGHQTGNLINADATDLFGVLRDRIMQHIERFLAREPDLPGHPYTQFAPDDCDFYMWATVLDEQGHQDPHIHPAGWVSGVYYVQVPPTPPGAPEQAGWIEFGQPETSVPGIDPSTTDLRHFPAREGGLFLFPSYYYHRTIPYTGERQRISIAFDLVPKRLRRLVGKSRPDAGQKRGQAQTGASPELARTVTGLLRNGRIDDARAVCAQALGKDSGDAVALAMMGQVTQQGGRPDQSMHWFRQSLAADPANLTARLGLIGLARQSRDHAEGLMLADEGIGGEDDTALRLARADLRIDLGRFDAARDDLHAVMERTPWLARAAWLLATLGDDKLRSLRLDEQLKACPPAQRIGLEFALGRLLEDAGDSTLALDRYRSANETMHRQLGRMLQPADAALLKRVFTGELFRDKAGGGAQSEAPLFIVGMPRTGSTLVERLLAAHPDVQTVGETDLLWRAVAELAGELPPGSRMPADIARLPADAAARAGEVYVSWLRRMAGDARIIVDRHLQNHAMLGVIQLILPNARVIRCRRDAADVRWACYRHWFDNVVPYAYDLGALAGAQQEDMVLHRLWDDTLSLRRLTVDYEDLAGDFDATVRRILGFCGLDWDPAVLRYADNPAPVISGDRIGVRRTVYTDAIGRAAPLRAFLDQQGIS